MKTYLQTGALTLVLSASLVLVGCKSLGQPVFDEDFYSLPGEQTTDLSVSVKRAIEASGQTGNLNIRVASLSEDSVKLTGFVPGNATFYEAERLAAEVSGVRHVVNSLVVR